MWRSSKCLTESCMEMHCEIYIDLPGIRSEYQDLRKLCISCDFISTPTPLQKDLFVLASLSPANCWLCQTTVSLNKCFYSRQVPALRRCAWGVWYLCTVHTHARAAAGESASSTRAVNGWGDSVIGATRGVGRVRVREGWWIEGRSRGEGRLWMPGDRRQCSSRVTPANIHLLPLLLTQIILQGNWVDYLPSQSVITSPPPTSDAVHLPVSARRQPTLTWGVQVSGHASADRVPNDPSGTFQDHERKNLPRWYMERVDSAQVIFMSGRTHIHSTAVRSACVRSYGYNKSKVQIWGFLFTDARDAGSSPWGRIMGF